MLREGWPIKLWHTVPKRLRQTHVFRCKGGTMFVRVEERQMRAWVEGKLNKEESKQCLGWLIDVEEGTKAPEVRRRGVRRRHGA